VLLSDAVVCTDYADAQPGELVTECLAYMVSADGQAAESAGSAPMSADLRETVSEIVATISEGTGHEGGSPAPDKGESTAIRPCWLGALPLDSGDLDKLDQRGGCSISVRVARSA